MKKQLHLSLLLLFVTVFISKAQLTGYSYLQPIRVYNTATITAIDYQLKLTINTQSIISASKMQANGNDIRFTKDCSGNSILNHWLEAGINTATTSIWVKIDSIPASGFKTIYMFSGNPTAISTSSIPLVFIGAKSATDSVASGSAGGVASSQRGFRFSPNEDILVTSFGKREPTGTTRYVTLFDNASTAIIDQIQVSGPAATYTYAPLSNPIWLTSGTQYVLELFQDIGDGYYFGTSSQINSKLTYYDMRYCNSCTQNTFPTNVLTNYHYGYPDLQFYWKNNITPAPTYSLGLAPAISVVQTASAVCLNDSVIISASANATGFTYTWNPGSITNGTISVTPTLTTTYSVSAMQTGCSVIYSDTALVSVNALPAISASTSDTTICIGQSATLTAVGGDTYTWTPSGSGTNIVVTPSVTTSYTVVGTSSVTGCSNTAIVTQNVNLCTGVNSIVANDNGFNIYPNPNNGKFLIDLENTSLVEVFDLLGEKVFSKEFKKGTNTIQLLNPAKGSYFVKIYSENKQINSKIIVD